MSGTQLDAVIDRVTAVFSGWTPDTTLDQIRREWDELFSDAVSVISAHSEPVDAGGVKAEWITAPGVETGRTIIYLHGGGYVLGSVNSHRDICERLSHLARARVLALNYRLAPEHPFPAPVEDALAAYKWILAQGQSASKLAICGDSAGGGLTLATMLALKEEGQSLPACVALMSPWVDMEMTGDSLDRNDAVDPMVHRPMVAAMVSMFLGAEGNPRHPLANPLYGDFTGLPPMLVHAGTRETLLDDSVRVAEKAQAAGVDVNLKIWDGQVHVFQIFASHLDQGAEAIAEIGSFITRHIS